VNRSTRLKARLAPEGRWLIRAGHALLPGVGLVDDCRVLVDGSRIEWVHDAASGEPMPELHGAHSIEALDCTLLPGLIDAHTHLTFSGGHDTVATLTAESEFAAVVRALGNAQVALAHGVTTQVDCGSKGLSVLDLRHSLRSGLAIGPRLLAAGAPITTTAGHCHWLGGRADSHDEVIRLARTLVADGVDLIKLMLTGGNMTVGSNPHQLQYPAEVVMALGREARRLGRPLVVHAHSEEAVALAAAAGARVIAHATCSVGDGIAISQATMTALLESGAFVDPTLMVGSVVRPDDPSAVGRSMTRSLMLPIFRAMHDAGIPLLAGTDGGSTNVGHHHVAGSIAALHDGVGLTIEQALLAATDVPARAFDLRDQVGAIEAGLQADLMLVRGDVRSGLACLYDPIAVWSGGRLVFEPGDQAGDEDGTAPTLSYSAAGQGTTSA
jgi:imidazolonepropionase-like amidohydrolase